MTNLEPAPVRNFRKLMENEVQLQEDLYYHLASGGSMIDFCEDREIDYGRLARWISADKERHRLISEAFEDRKEFAKEKILTELNRLAHFDPRQLFDENNNLKDPSEWSREVASMVSNFEVSVNKDGDKIAKVKLWNKEKALELLGKNIQMFIDRVDHSGKLSLEELITLSRKEHE